MVQKASFFLKSIYILILYLVAIMFVYAIFNGPFKGEAYIGSFTAKDLNDGWDIAIEGGETDENVSLPFHFAGKEWMKLNATNVVPEDANDGMRLCIRVVRQNVTVYINGKERGTYRASDFSGDRKKTPSAFLFVDLRKNDAGGELRLDIEQQNNELGVINRMSYAYGNNSWFPLIVDNIFNVIIAFNLVFIGFLIFIAYFIIHRKLNSAAILYLAETMMATGLWSMSESPLRQILFKSPSYSNVFAFVLVESIAVFAAMFINEIQNNRYNTLYLILEVSALIQLAVNSVLNFLNVVDFYNTLNFSHIWSGLVIIASAVTIILDLRSGRVKKYGITAFGLLLFIATSLLEIVNFYISATYSLGAFIGIGLIFLLIATIMQTVADSIRAAEERRLESERMNMMTFRTIAGTLDAKDEYTGGHSERVGEYARKICEKAAEKYGFTEDDLSRIQYIGRMHDIGKIGVPDRVLNKNGRLDDEEFALMKKHPTIGGDILKTLDDAVPDLSKGARYHHERFDGKGYPEGLKGSEIPVYARILCLADCFDAMTTDRVYRKRLSRERVIEEIRNNRGSQFDPELADLVLQMIDSGELEC